MHTAPGFLAARKEGVRQRFEMEALLLEKRRHLTAGDQGKAAQSIALLRAV